MKEIEIQNIIELFLVLLRKKEFFNAHELLEDNLWDKRSKTAENLYFKGLINAAVAMELIKRNKVNQSEKVFHTFLKYKLNVEKYKKINEEVELIFKLLLSDNRI